MKYGKLEATILVRPNVTHPEIMDLYISYKDGGFSLLTEKSSGLEPYENIVDLERFPEAKKFLENNFLAKPIGPLKNGLISGVFQKYRFNKERLQHYDTKGVALYESQLNLNQEETKVFRL